jgi:hypothetical protein
MRNGLITVTKLSYGFDCVVVLYVCSCCYVQNGGGAVDLCPFDIFFVTDAVRCYCVTESMFRPYIL